MTAIPLTTKTPEEIDVDFDAEFKDEKPDGEKKPLTLADGLAPYRKAIMRQRKRGLAWNHIAAVMARSRINVKVSGKTLQKIFGKPDAKKSRSPAPAPLPRLALDPVTGQPIAVAPPPAPMTPKEHELYDRLLVGLIPPIVKVKMNRHDARSYANNAVEMMRPREAVRLHELLTAELDGLTETNCGRYGVPPEEVAPWKRRWV